MSVVYVILGNYISSGTVVLLRTALSDRSWCTLNNLHHFNLIHTYIFLYVFEVCYILQLWVPVLLITDTLIFIAEWLMICRIHFMYILHTYLSVERSLSSWWSAVYMIMYILHLFKCGQMSARCLYISWCMMSSLCTSTYFRTCGITPLTMSTPIGGPHDCPWHTKP